MIKKISGKEFQEARDADVALIDFSATWCGPCRMLAPVLSEVSEDMAGSVSFFNVDVDENPDLALEFGIQSIPALVILKHGVQAAMQVGFMPKENIESFIKSNL